VFGMTDVVVLVGAGSIGQAIARRVGAGRHVILTDRREGDAEATADVFRSAGFEASAAAVDVTDRRSVEALAERAARAGRVTHLVHAAGMSPAQGSPATVLRVDLYGCALVLEVFGVVVVAGGSGLVVASQSGHLLPAFTGEEERLLAVTPADDLMSLPMLHPDRIHDSVHAYQLAKRGNAVRVRAEAVRWGRRGARVNSVSPGIIATPMSQQLLTGPGGHEFQALIDGCPAGRPGTPDEVATVAALLLGPDGSFLTGSDVLIDGGLTASALYGPL
jgi:NAD(P)-dependent dehydrogenase (short-subunit alcohol dehydrogenase family)